jgi:hypothetical protein
MSTGPRIPGSEQFLGEAFKAMVGKRPRALRRAGCRTDNSWG